MNPEELENHGKHRRPEMRRGSIKNVRAVLRAAEAGRREILAAHGGCVGPAEAARLLGGCNEAALRLAVRAKRVIAAKEGEWLYPVWQFMPQGGVVDRLSEILSILSASPAYDDMLPFAFFLSPNHITGGRMPIEALVRGDFESIERAARARIF